MAKAKAPEVEVFTTTSEHIPAPEATTTEATTTDTISITTELVEAVSSNKELVEAVRVFNLTEAIDQAIKLAQEEVLSTQIITRLEEAKHFIQR